jgi:hypothetical protein
MMTAAIRSAPAGAISTRTVTLTSSSAISRTPTSRRTGDADAEHGPNTATRSSTAGPSTAPSIRSLTRSYGCGLRQRRRSGSLLHHRIRGDTSRLWRNDGNWYSPT